jgi:chromosome segregation ATPase
MASSRKIRRSRRAFAAIALLVTAVLVAVVGIVVATVPVLIVATTYAVITGVLASRLLSNEIGQLRRDWARDRADIADDHRRTSVVRSREQIAFAEQMSSRIRLKDAQLEILRDSLVTAEIDLAKARERLSAERARVEALTSDLDSAATDLESARVDLRNAMDVLATSEGAEIQARAEVQAWEASATEAERQLHQRLA